MFYAVVALILLAAGVIVWNAFGAFGWLDKFEGLVGSLASGSFNLRAGKVLEAGLLLAVAFVIGLTIATSLLCVIYNLISDIVGGFTITVQNLGADGVRSMAPVRTKRNIVAARPGARRPTRTETTDGLDGGAHRKGVNPGPPRGRRQGRDISSGAGDASHAVGPRETTM